MQLAAELAIRGNCQLARIGSHTGKQLLQGRDRKQAGIANPLQTGRSQPQEALLAAPASDGFTAQPADRVCEAAVAICDRAEI